MVPTLVLGGWSEGVFKTRWQNREQTRAEDGALLAAKGSFQAHNLINNEDKSRSRDGLILYRKKSELKKARQKIDTCA